MPPGRAELKKRVSPSALRFGFSSFSAELTPGPKAVTSGVVSPAMTAPRPMPSGPTARKLLSRSWRRCRVTRGGPAVAFLFHGRVEDQLRCVAGPSYSPRWQWREDRCPGRPWGSSAGSPLDPPRPPWPWPAPHCLGRSVRPSAEVQRPAPPQRSPSGRRPDRPRRDPGRLPCR